MDHNIFLVGFMGAGKSTVGRRLARHLGYRYADLDDLIVAREGMPIPEIFARKGEAAFRDSEAAVLSGLSRSSRTVFATGGGIVGRAENRLLMKERGIVVYLRASWPILEQRLARESGRPLADPQKGMAAIRALWESRLAWYEEADIVIDTDRLPVDGVVRAIAAHLDQEGKTS